MPRHMIQVRVNLLQNSRNNNSDTNNSFTHVMIQRYRLTFLQLSLSYARVFSLTQRNILEFIVLVMALLSFTSLIYFHIIFVHLPIPCLESYQKDWESAKILRVELLRKNGNANYSLFDSYYKEHSIKLQEAGLKPCPKIQHLHGYENSSESTKSRDFSNQEKTLDLYDLLSCTLNESRTDKSLFETISEEIGMALNVPPTEEMNIVEYSLEDGFLKLSPAMRKKLNISVLYVVIDPNEDSCVGSFFLKFISDKFLGYEELLISSIKYFAAKSDFKGYVRNVGSEVVYLFTKHSWWCHQSYLISAISVPLMTFSLTILLRFTNEQLLRCYPTFFNLARPGRSRLNEGIPILAALFAIFGLLTITFSYYDNPVWIRNIVFTVWLADLYNTICCQSSLSKRHWYKFFLLYLYVCYAYNHRFHGLNWQLNLLTTWLFVLHSQLYFFHHYELPFYMRTYVHIYFENRQNLRIITSLIAMVSPHASAANRPPVPTQSDGHLPDREVPSIENSPDQSNAENNPLTEGVQDLQAESRSPQPDVSFSNLRNSSGNSLEVFSNELDGDVNHDNESVKEVDSCTSKCSSEEVCNTHSEISHSKEVSDNHSQISHTKEETTLSSSRCDAACSSLCQKPSERTS